MAWFRRDPARQGVAPIPTLNNEEAQTRLRDLRDVGPSKPSGMLPHEVIRACGETPERMAAEAENHGLYVHQTEDAGSRQAARPDQRASLYVADRRRWRLYLSGTRARSRMPGGRRGARRMWTVSRRSWSGPRRR